MEAVDPNNQWIDDLSAHDIREAVHEGLMEVLGGYGFVHDTAGEHQLMLRFPGGFHRVTVPIRDDKPVFRFTFQLATRLDAVAAITAAFSGTSEHTCSVVGGKEYAIDSRPGLALAVTEMNIALVNKLLPLLDTISDVRGLEALYNAPDAGIAFQTDKDDGYTALTLARLAGNPAFAAMCPLILDSLPEGKRDARSKLQRLIAYLEHYDPANPAPPSPSDAKARFIADYNGSQKAELEAGASFRTELMREAGPSLASFSLRLLRDIFRAQAQACRAEGAFDTWTLANPACALLCRGGVGELELFAQSVPAPALSAPAMLDIPIPAAMAESLRHACEERTSNPMFSERRQQYVALEQFFSAIAASGH